MLPQLDSSQIQQINKALALASAIEKSQFNENLFDSENYSRCQQISEILGAFSESKELALKKLADIPKHFDPQMPLRHFVHLMIPLERLVDRQVRDQDFLPDELAPDRHDRLELKLERRPLYFILDNLRSAFNVGSIFRLADSVGVSELAICGYTPTPDQGNLKKTSMTADKYVKYRSFAKTETAILHYQNLGVQVLALETAIHAPSIFEKPISGPTAFLLGNERFGLDNQLLSMANELRKIPMFGIKNSLNVGQAAAIAAFEWSRQNP